MKVVYDRELNQKLRDIAKSNNMGDMYVYDIILLVRKRTRNYRKR